MAATDSRLYIAFPEDFSDGNPSTWPGPPYVNVPIGSPSDLLWKDKTGQTIAQMLGYPDSHRYSIQNWPTGYALFANPRPPSSASGRREDLYLLGGPKRYRSSSEFLEHAVWLLFHGLPPSHLTERLASLRTSGKPRKSQSMLTPSSSQTRDRHSPSKPIVISDDDDDDTLRLKESPAQRKPTRPNGPKHMFVVKVEDGESKPFPPLKEQLDHPKRRYRVGELVWCVIEPPLRGDTPSHTIDLWPGIVETYRFQKRTSPFQAEEDVEFTVHETVLFQVKLLALTDTFHLPQSKIYPFKGYLPKSGLITLLQAFPPTNLDDLPRELYHFHQNVTYLSVQHSDADMLAPSDTFTQATAPYSLALQNAAHVSRYWGFVYPQIPKGHSESWNEGDEIHYSGLWWGAELIYVGEMVSLVMNRTQLALHPSMANFLPYPTANDTSAVLLQPHRIMVRANLTRSDDKRKAFVRGPLFELVPISSGVGPDPADLTPSQNPPEGFVWKRLLPRDYEAQISIQLIAGRYYEDDIGDIVRGDHIPPEMSLALHGMAPGYFHGSNPPIAYMNTRAEMARTARRCGQSDLIKYWNIQ